MIEGILITEKGLIEVGFIDDEYKNFLLKPKSDVLLSDSKKIEYGYILHKNKIYLCKYLHSKENFRLKRAGTGRVLTEVYSLSFDGIP